MSNTVQSVSRIDARQWLITLGRPISAIDKYDVVENVTWTPELLVNNNRFIRIPTRGILVTTRRKVVIENNLFERTGMSAVLIADDAESWFESGMVMDVAIRSNRFVECGDNDHPVILIAPENQEARADCPVHRNITIADNAIETCFADILYAKSVSGLRLLNNEIKVPVSVSKPYIFEDAILLTACSDIEIQGNEIVGGSCHEQSQ